MKKSEMYKALQIMVLKGDVELFGHDKLQILRELMYQEDLAKFAEEQAEKENEAVTGG